MQKEGDTLGWDRPQNSSIAQPDCTGTAVDEGFTVSQWVGGFRISAVLQAAYFIPPCGLVIQPAGKSSVHVKNIHFQNHHALSLYKPISLSIYVGLFAPTKQITCFLYIYDEKSTPQIPVQTISNQCWRWFWCNGLIFMVKIINPLNALLLAKQHL